LALPQTVLRLPRQRLYGLNIACYNLAAQRMNMLYGFNSPEFFDRSLFENFIDLLRERSVLKAGEGGNLEFDEVLIRVAADAQLVLSEQIRHSILQVTQV